MKTILCTVAALATTTLAVGTQAAVISVNASDATYVRSNDAATNFQSSGTNVANDNGGSHRIALWTFDFSSISDPITGVTLSLQENAGGGLDEYEVFGLGDGTIDLSAITWNSAVTDGQVASNRPVGTSLGTFISDGGGSSYSLTLSAAFFEADVDGLVTIAIVDNTVGVDGIGWADGAVLNVSTVPEPGSLALLGLGGLALLRRRRA